jgi:hypothetical protein
MLYFQTLVILLFTHNKEIHFTSIQNKRYNYCFADPLLAFWYVDVTMTDFDLNDNKYLQNWFFSLFNEPYLC